MQIPECDIFRDVGDPEAPDLLTLRADDILPGAVDVEIESGITVSIGPLSARDLRQMAEWLRTVADLIEPGRN